MSFAGFEERDVETPRGIVHARVGGEGPPLLLLHGFPQTHVMWHPVAEALVARHTVVAADLPVSTPSPAGHLVTVQFRPGSRTDLPVRSV